MAVEIAREFGGEGSARIRVRVKGFKPKFIRFLMKPPFIVDSKTQIPSITALPSGPYLSFLADEAPVWW